MDNLSDNLSYKISPALESHISFVFNSSLRSHKGTFPLYLIDDSTYFRVYHDIMAKAIKDLGVSVAHNPDDPDHILGYCIGNGYEIAYVYVKQDYRGLGIATDLIRQTLTCGDGPTYYYSPCTKYRLLTRSGAGLLKYLESFVLQDVDFQYELPSEVKKDAVRKEEEKAWKEKVANPTDGGEPDKLLMHPEKFKELKKLVDGTC